MTYTKALVNSLNKLAGLLWPRKLRKNLM